jgi:tetratricopeptide (TPR) repeat protein
MTKLHGNDDAESAIRIGQRILALDPMHEVAVRHMMRLYADIGRRGAAIQLYQSLGRVLRTELNAEPEPATRSLFAELSNVKRQTAAAAEREKRPVISTEAGSQPPASIKAVPMLTVTMPLRSRLTIPRWIAWVAPVLTIGFLSFQWFWSLQSWEVSSPLRVGPSAESPASSRDIDPESYEQFLYAKSLVQGQMGVFGPQPIVDAVESLERLTARYPNYAPAWSLLAQAYDNLPGSTWNPGYQFLPDDDDLVRNIHEPLGKAEGAAREALRLDPKNADAYLALGRLQQSRGKLVEAHDLLSKAFQLEPNNSGVLRQYSTLLSEVGRPTAALSMQGQLVAQEAFVPNVSMNRARYLWLNGENEAAIAILKTLPNGRPNNNIARILASMGRFSEAARLLAEDAATPNPPEWIDDAVRRLLAAPAKVVAPENLPRLGLTESYIYAYIGAPERVLEPYEAVAETGYAPNVYIQFVGLLWHPAYSSVRQTERFKRFARKVGLVEYWRAKGWPEFCRPTIGDEFECN